MEIKKTLCNILKKNVEKNCAASTASFCLFGTEKMPESMKKRR